VVECLLTKYESLTSNPSTTKVRERERDLECHTQGFGKDKIGSKCVFPVVGVTKERREQALIHARERAAHRHHE
jgi:hypothetical protein